MPAPWPIRPRADNCEEGADSRQGPSLPDTSPNSHPVFPFCPTDEEPEKGHSLPKGTQLANAEPWL